jgi:hypothetical protein
VISIPKSTNTRHTFSSIETQHTAFAAVAIAAAAAVVAVSLHPQQQLNQPKTSYPFDPLPRPTYISLHFG